MTARRPRRGLATDDDPTTVGEWRALTDEASLDSPDLDLDGFMLLHPEPSDRLRLLWARHQVQILSAWTAAQPGTRPSSWWRLDAPEPRRRIGVKARVLRAGAVAFGDWRLRYGIPCAHLVHKGDLFESEATYLGRHGLLSDLERARLGPADFAPVRVRPAG